MSCDKKLASAVVFEIEQRLISGEIVAHTEEEFNHYLKLLDSWLQVNKLSREHITKTSKKSTEVLLRYLRQAGYLPADLLPIRQIA